MCCVADSEMSKGRTNCLEKESEKEKKNRVHERRADCFDKNKACEGAREHQSVWAKRRFWGDVEIQKFFGGRGLVCAICAVIGAGDDGDG